MARDLRDLVEAVRSDWGNWGTSEILMYYTCNVVILPRLYTALRIRKLLKKIRCNSLLPTECRPAGKRERERDSLRPLGQQGL